MADAFGGWDRWGICSAATKAPLLLGSTYRSTGWGEGLHSPKLKSRREVFIGRSNVPLPDHPLTPDPSPPRRGRGEKNRSWNDFGDSYGSPKPPVNCQMPVQPPQGTFRCASLLPLTHLNWRPSPRHSAPHFQRGQGQKRSDP